MKSRLFLSCDWGTSTFRLRCVNAETGERLKEVSSDQGIATVHQQWLQQKPGGFERILFYFRYIQDALTSFPAEMRDGLPVFMSGMASSSIGMKMLEYTRVPLSITANHLGVDRLTIADHTVFLVSGLQTGDDVLRGEETILLGIANLFTDAQIILPGTHSKQVSLQNGVIQQFQTYMTGELFELLSKHSTLAASVHNKDNGFCREAFIDGLHYALQSPLLHAIFRTRTRQLLQQLPANENFDWLSGLLIGSEIWNIPSTPEQIVLCASGPLRERYELAIQTLHPQRPLTTLDADNCLIKGHILLFQHL